MWSRYNSLLLFKQNKKLSIMDWAKMKAFADDKLNLAEVMFSIHNGIYRISPKQKVCLILHFFVI